MKKINSEKLMNEIANGTIDYLRYFNDYGKENTIAVAIDIIYWIGEDREDYYDFEYDNLKKLFNTIRKRKDNETEFEYVKNICIENNFTYLTEDDEPYADPVIVIGDTDFDLYENGEYIDTLTNEMPIGFNYKGEFMYIG